VACTARRDGLGGDCVGEGRRDEASADGGLRMLRASTTRRGGGDAATVMRCPPAAAARSCRPRRTRVVCRRSQAVEQMVVGQTLVVNHGSEFSAVLSPRVPSESRIGPRKRRLFARRRSQNLPLKERVYSHHRAERRECLRFHREGARVLCARGLFIN
jgi:hypothetical protein